MKHLQLAFVFLGSTLQLAFSGKRAFLNQVRKKWYIPGTPRDNRTVGEEDLNRNAFKDICVDLSSYNTGCRFKHCDTTEQFRSIDGCCNNIGHPDKGKKKDSSYPILGFFEDIPVLHKVFRCP